MISRVDSSLFWSQWMLPPEGSILTTWKWSFSCPFRGRGGRYQIFLFLCKIDTRMKCPYCGSENTSPAEREYTTDYPFWMVLVAVFFLIGVMLLLFFFLQLHPVIMILILVAVITKLLDTRSRTRRKTQKIEYICLSCDRRFTQRKSSPGEE